ncbi:MAG: hypothetical protein J7K58_00985, partial [Euryarchaeota archaeon]|nr:hypothetical protein [Euryarchaeota archaeon]
RGVNPRMRDIRDSKKLEIPEGRTPNDRPMNANPYGIILLEKQRLGLRFHEITLTPPEGDSCVVPLGWRVVARALYLEYFGDCEHGLPPQPLHQVPWPHGGDIDRHHRTRLTWD